ncbi:CopC domain-containing protein, partial [Lachnospiraceae bacterium XBB1006]
MKMKKRLLSILLSLALMLGLMPGMNLTTYATEGTAWNLTDSLPVNGGVYYLEKDVIVTTAQKAGTRGDSTWYIENNTTIDLNGHSITLRRNDLWNNIEIKANTTFTIKDSAGNGVIRQDRPDNKDSQVIIVNGVLNLEGGTITGGKFSDPDNGGTGAGVVVQKSGTFNMSGGVITGNTLTYTGHNSSYRGAAGVYCNYSAGQPTFNMTGGTISGNTANGEFAYEAIGHNNSIKGTISGGYIQGTCTNISSITGGFFTVNPSSDGFCKNGAIPSTHMVKEINETIVGVNYKYQVVPIPTHTHDFKYYANDATITAICTADGCSLPPTTEGGSDHVAKLILVKPTLTTYGQSGAGISTAATLTGLSDFNAATGKNVAATDIKYVGRNNTTYVESSTAPTNAGDYTAKITVEEKTASVEYTIAKGNPTANAPTGLTATYGQTLADVTLTNPDGNTPGTWEWVDAGTTGVGSVGNQTFRANFTPTDTGNYKAVSNMNVTVTVGKATSPVTIASTAVVTRGGRTVNLANNVTLNGATGNVTYAINGEANGCTLSGSTLTSGNNTGNVIVNVSVAADDNYDALAATPITVTISDKGTQTITASDVTATYGEIGKKVEATTDGNGAISYAVKEGSADYIDVDATTGALTIKKVGTATVIVTAAETATYAQANKEVTVTINKANSTVTKAPTAKTLTYNGQAQALVTAGTTASGEMQYALGTETAATEPYTTSIPTATDAGTYYVWYKAVGDDAHSDSEPKCIIVTIRAEGSGGDGAYVPSTPTPTTPAESYTVPVSNENTVNISTNISA